MTTQKLATPLTDEAALVAENELQQSGITSSPPRYVYAVFARKLENDRARLIVALRQAASSLGAHKAYGSEGDALRVLRELSEL